MKRSIKQIIPAQKVNMGGHLLDQPLPYRKVDQIDPFLLVHHWKNELKGGQHQREVGVGPHPHRGFSPVTFIFNGSVHHRDSTGSDNVVDAGGTQWMNSGRGIVHSERPSKTLAESGGIFEIIQFWVNAPASEKMNPPSYQPLPAENTPEWQSPDGKVTVGVVAGEFNKIKPVIQASSELLILRMKLKSGGQIELPVPEHYNALLYELDGKLMINDQTETSAKDMIWFENDGQEVSVKALEDTQVILLSGKPIGEPVSTYGPFVMNSQQEIMKALYDYQNGDMGQLIEQFD